jgi:hypothetical protein
MLTHPMASNPIAVAPAARAPKVIARAAKPGLF